MIGYRYAHHVRRSEHMQECPDRCGGTGGVRISNSVRASMLVWTRGQLSTQSSVLPDGMSCFSSAQSRTSHLHAGGSGASWIELERELAEDLRPKRGSFAADGEIGLAAADPGRLCVLSMGDTVLWLFWLSTESVDDDERERRMYGRGGGFFGSSVGGMGFSTGGGTSAPYSSTIRGGGRSTIASSSCMRPNS